MPELSYMEQTHRTIGINLNFPPQKKNIWLEIFYVEPSRWQQRSKESVRYLSVNDLPF